MYFAFPFAMDHPRFAYETQNGYVDPARDLLPGASLEWFCMQHWVSVRQGDVTAALVPLDAPLITLGDIARGTWPTEFGQRKTIVFSYAMNNYTPEGYLAGQGGDFVFRYVLTSGEGFEPGLLGRLGREQMIPLEVDEIRPNDKASYVRRGLDSRQFSFLRIDNTNLALVTWKLAEDRKGTILRFLEIAGKEGVAKVTIPLVEIESAWICNAVEDNQRSLPFAGRSLSFDVKPFSIVTVRIEGKPTSTNSTTRP